MWQDHIKGFAGLKQEHFESWVRHVGHYQMGDSLISMSVTIQE